MKVPLLLVVFVIVVAAVTVFPKTGVAEPVNSIDLGFGGLPQLLPHCKSYVYSVEYERMIGSKMAVLGRGGEVDYRFDDGKYREEGRPKGIDVGVRYYPAGNGMKGLFFSGTVGYWAWDWTFTDDKNTSLESHGTGNTKAVRADLDIGGRFPISSTPVSIIPALHIGKFFTSNSCDYNAPASRVGTSCSKNTEIGYYAFVSLSVGIAF